CFNPDAQSGPRWFLALLLPLPFTGSPLFSAPAIRDVSARPIVCKVRQCHVIPVAYGHRRCALLAQNRNETSAIRFPRVRTRSLRTRDAWRDDASAGGGAVIGRSRESVFG